MTVVTIHKAKTELSKLIARVEAGEEIEIARRDKVVARLVPSAPVARKKHSGRGAWKGLMPMPDFLAPMAEEELAEREGPIEPSA